MDQSDVEKLAPTLRGVAGPARARRSRAWRRVGVVLMVLVVLAAASGWLGPRDTTATDSGDGAQLQATYPHLTRAGADSTLELTIERTDASTPVVVELSTAAFDRLGLETIVPTPTSESARDGLVRLTFDDFPAGRATVQVFGRLPTRTSAGPFSYPITVQGAGPVALNISARTWVLP